MSLWLLVQVCSECKSVIYNALSGRHKYWAQHEVNMPRGSGSVDKAPDSQWIYAGSKLERRKHWFLHLASRLYEPKRENKYVVTSLIRQWGHCLYTERSNVVNGKALSIMRCRDEINTEHMKSIGRAAVAQWTKRLTHNGQTRVRIREAHIFDITYI